MNMTFDTETIRLITLFENMTHAGVKDCLVDDDRDILYFVIEEGDLGIAIGKNGNSVKRVEDAVGKTIKLFEFSKDVVQFAKNVIPQATEVKVRNENGNKYLYVRVERKSKPLVIGRGRRNLKVYKELFERSHGIKDLTVR